MRKSVLILSLAAITFMAFMAFMAVQASAAGLISGTWRGPQVNTVIQPGDIKWGPAPDVLPAGAQVAVLMGNPFDKGAFILRIKMPAGYTIPPHWHPTAEVVTVLSGEFHLGQGADLDKPKADTMGVGAFAVIEPKEDHFAFAGEKETVVQVSGEGPFQITYVHPDDDPRKPQT